jgi:hypothetical protein
MDQISTMEWWNVKKKRNWEVDKRKRGEGIYILTLPVCAMFPTVWTCVPFYYFPWGLIPLSLSYDSPYVNDLSRYHTLVD